MSLVEESPAIATDWLEKPGSSWWVKVVTDRPICIYYFGPFDTFQGARGSRSGYLEDLEEEGARIVAAEIKQCQPRVLTVIGV